MLSSSWGFVVHLVEVAFEVVEAGAPQRPVRSKPLVHLAQRFGSNPIDPPLSLNPGVHQAGVPEQAQMLGDGRLGHRQSGYQLADRAFSQPQQVQDLAPVALR
jgi:hypothetical protein